MPFWNCHICIFPGGWFLTIYNAAFLGKYFTWNLLEWNLRKTWRNWHSWHRHHMHHWHGTGDSCCHWSGLHLSLTLDLFLFWFIIYDKKKNNKIDDDIIQSSKKKLNLCLPFRQVTLKICKSVLLFAGHLTLEDISSANSKWLPSCCRSEVDVPPGFAITLHTRISIPVLQRSTYHRLHYYPSVDVLSCLSQEYPPCHRFLFLGLPCLAQSLESCLWFPCVLAYSGWPALGLYIASCGILDTWNA